MAYRWRLAFGFACMVSAIALVIYSVRNGPWIPDFMGSTVLIAWSVYYALFHLRCQSCGFPVLMRSDAEGIRYGSYEQIFHDPCPYCGGNR